MDKMLYSSVDNVEDYVFDYDEREVNLSNLLPQIYKQIADYRAMVNSSGREVHKLYEKLTESFNNQFISTSSLESIRKWEERFGITPNGTDTLEERRFRVLAKFTDFPPYTERYLIDRLNDLCGVGNWRMFTDYESYRLVVQITLESLANNETVLNVVRSIIPANLELDVQRFRVRYSELNEYTHSELGEYTQEELKYPDTFETEELIP